MQYKSGAKRNLRQIANELGVAHVVEGSVQRAANRVRVSAQLIDAKTDTHLWANSYDRPLDDVFAIQSDIAKAIAGQLQAKLSPAEKQQLNTHRQKTSSCTIGTSVPRSYGQNLNNSAVKRILAKSGNGRWIRR